VHPHSEKPKHEKLKAVEPVAETPISDGLLEVHLCGPSRELLEVIRIESDKRRHKIAWNGHHYEHFDTIANDVWRYCQVD
jgi:hypothetical protein